MTISRAEYNMLADTTAKQISIAGTTTQSLMGHKIITALCSALKNNNPRFNIHKFVKAVVEVEKKYNPDVPF